ncbi:MerR family DNA-binding transcriptional regulator [Siminovitchia sediminis]|uniref:MerR family DNA-binding transcriptional regulator n=1 Tax=Siminovitchia sediminis TaxID=1274353 RepID=A0ABW4KHK8_9BACI
MDMKVKEVAELVGVSIRTLHHYDQIGLLSPKEITDSGYQKKTLKHYNKFYFSRNLDSP